MTEETADSERIENSAENAGHEPAAYPARFFAYLIDLVLISIVATSVLFIVKNELFNRDVTTWAFRDQLTRLIVIRGLFYLYELALLARSGQTLGKKLLKIKVVRSDGKPLDLRFAAVRPLIRQSIEFACLVAMEYYGRQNPVYLALAVVVVLNYAVMFLNRKRACFHDLVATTRVVSAK